MLNVGATNLEALLEAMPDAVMVVDQPGVIRFVNHRATNLFGYQGEDLVGRPIDTLVPEWSQRVQTEDRADTAAYSQSSAVGAGLVLTGRRRDGSQFPVDISATTIDTEDGPAVVAAMSDTTDRDMATRLSAILESSHDAIVERSPEGVITGWNPAAQELYGYSYEEVIGKSITILNPQDRVEEIEVTLAMVRTGESAKPLESVRVRKDGTKVSVSLNISPVRDADGALVGSYAIAHDLTDRKKAEVYARRMAALVEGSNDGIVDATLDGVITTWNPAAERMFGISSQEVIGKSLLTLAPKDRLEELAVLIAKVEAGDPTEPYECVSVRPDGTGAFVSLTVSPVKDADGVIVGVSGIVHDLTERRRAELEHLRMAAIVEGSNDAIIDVTLDGVITSWNPAAERIYGISSQAVIGKSFLALAPKQGQALAGILAKVREGQPIEPFESVVVRRDGTEVFLSRTVSPVKDADGVVVGASAIVRDLTERRGAELEHRRMAAIVEGSNDAIIDVTIDGVITSWNPAAERLFGYSREEAIGMSCGILCREGHADEDIAVLAEIAAGKANGHYEGVRVRKDGTEVYVSFTLSPVKDADDVIVGVSAIIRDLTKRRHDERDIRLMAAIVESASEAIVVTSPDGVIMGWNPAAEELFGYSREEAIGMSGFVLTPEGHRDEDERILAQIRAGEPVGVYESVRIRKDGTEVPVSFKVSTVKDADGAIIGIAGINHDKSTDIQARRDIADWRGKAFKWMEDLERFQRLSVMRDFERELKVIDLQREVERLRAIAPPDSGEPDD